MKTLLAIAFGTTLALPLVASAQDYQRYDDGGRRDGGQRDVFVSARIRAVNGSAITLDNGRTVFLRGSTSIDGRLYPGERIAVRGDRAGDGNINARSVSVTDRGRGGYRAGYNPSDAGRDDRNDVGNYNRNDARNYDPNGGRRGFDNGSGNGAVFGRIRSVNGGAVTLDNGRTIFLKSNTSVNGSLQPGQRISVQGSDAGDGNINASSINVIGS